MTTATNQQRLAGSSDPPMNSPRPQACPAAPFSARCAPDDLPTSRPSLVVGAGIEGMAAVAKTGLDEHEIGKLNATVTEYGQKAGEQYSGRRAEITSNAAGVAGNHGLHAGARHAYLANPATSSAGLATRSNRVTDP